MHEQVNIPDVVRRAVAQPLIVKQGDDFDNADALHEWGMMLGERWPLWALRAEAFRRLNGLPALTYPLSACVRSICRDEGLDRASSVDGLDALVDHRRVALVTGERFAWDSAELCEDEEARSWWSFGSDRTAFPAPEAARLSRAARCRSQIVPATPAASTAAIAHRRPLRHRWSRWCSARYAAAVSLSTTPGTTRPDSTRSHSRPRSRSSHRMCRSSCWW
jgi:hypothetical protein